MLEICIDNLESARNAILGGAGRLELCSALSEGGLTPTPGLAKLVKNISNGSVPVYAMLRVRQGDFIYSLEEAEAMLEDLEHLKEAGVDGFVFGALTSKGNVDQELCKRILKGAHPLPVTFHRAFDDALSDPLETLKILVGLGFQRLLTSGRESSAEKGLELISELKEKAKDEIIVMPGAGINPGNLSRIRDRSGAKEFHASAKKSKGGEGIFGGGFVADRDVVAEMARILKVEEK